MANADLRLQNIVAQSARELTEADGRFHKRRLIDADAQVQDYVDQRIDAFRTHTDVLYLGDLERGVFGWTEDPTAPPESGSPKAASEYPDRSLF
jgi:hypothetical protein